MAKNTEEILKSLIDAGADADLYKAYLATDGLTDDDRERNFLSQYHGAEKDLDDRWANLEGTPLALPTLKKVYEVLDIHKDGEGRSELEQFVKDFPKNQGAWKKAALANDKIGEKGWESIRDMWRKTALDYYQGEDAMKEGRIAAMYNAGNILPGIGDVGDIPLSNGLAYIMHPRSVERIESGESPTTKDVVLDQAENLAMSVPGIGWTGKAYRVLSSLPKIGRLAERGMKTLETLNRMKGALPQATGYSANILKTLAGNSVVPVGMEIADSQLYGDDEGMDRRARFSYGDAATGTAVNQLVSRGLFRQGAPLLMNVSGEITRGAGINAMRDFLNKVGSDFSAPGKRFAEDVFDKAAVKDIVSRELLSPGEVNAANLGNMAFKNSLTKEESDAAKATADVLNAIKVGAVTPEDVKKIVMYGKDAGYNDKLTKEILAHPREFVNYANWNGRGEGSATMLQKALNEANVGGTSFAVNKAGKEEFTKQLFNNLYSLGQMIKEEREEKHSAPKKARAEAALKSFIDNAQNEEDRMFLGMIAKDPKIIGDENSSPEFKKWLITRGYGLLKNSAAAVPTWDIR